MPQYCYAIADLYNHVIDMDICTAPDEITVYRLCYDVPQEYTIEDIKAHAFDAEQLINVLEIGP